MFINQIRKEGPKEYIYQELQHKGVLDFDNVTKTSALKYGNLLGRRMVYIRDEQDIANLLRIEYAFEEFDAADIQIRMDKLTPKNMFAIFHSKLVQAEMDAEPHKFQTERFYTKHFSVSKLGDDVLDNLA